jgi:hypothetical protein
MTVVLAAVIIFGIAIFIFGITKVIAGLSETSGSTDIGLTTAQTREAIDKQLPVLANVVEASFEDQVATLQTNGQHVLINDRYVPESPDVGAQGREIISLPSAVSDEFIQGFYQGTYNAYSPQELKDNFNGAYVLSMTRGALGAWNKIKYVNLNATSIDDEITRLRAVQELNGDNVVVSAQGTDSRDNKVIQGTKGIGDRVLYWKIAACPFNEVYNADSINSSAVYITCTVATYDFYTGQDTIKQ